MKKMLSIILSLTLIVSVSMASFAEQKYTMSSKNINDINFIKKNYNLTTEEILELSDGVFDKIKNLETKGTKESFKYYKIINKEALQFDTQNLNILETPIYNNTQDSKNYVFVEVSKQEFEKAEAQNEMEKSSFFDSNKDVRYKLNGSDVTKDHGWVKLRTLISYIPSIDEYLITNQTKYLKGSYITLSPKVEFFSGIGVNNNMSIINKNVHAIFKYDFTSPLGSGSENQTKDEADKTNSDGYGFKFSLPQAPDFYVSDVYMSCSVFAAENVSNLQIADAWGHFSYTKGSINLDASLGINDSNLSIKPTSKTTEINPNHVQYRH